MCTHFKHMVLRVCIKYIHHWTQHHNQDRICTLSQKFPSQSNHWSDVCHQRLVMFFLKFHTNRIIPSELFMVFCTTCILVIYVLCISIACSSFIDIWFLCTNTKMCLSIHLLKDIAVASCLWLLRIKQWLTTCLNKSFFVSIF
jgi:hypothetical protein